MPGFANLPLAAGAAAVAIPALLLLYFLKLRRKEMPISSTLLWRKTIEDLQVNAPFQRLRKNLLLLLQLLLILLLCLALARPTRKSGEGLGKKAVLLIDQSASMNAVDSGKTTRLELARQRADDLVREMGSDSQAMVIEFADTAQVVQGFTSDRGALRNAIDAIAPTDRRTKFELAYKLVEAQGADAEAWLFSDGRADDAGRARVRAVLHDEKIGKAETDNVGIVTMDARRNYDDPTQVQIFVRLANFGKEVVSPDVQLSVAPMDATGELKWQVVKVASSCLFPAHSSPEQRLATAKVQNLTARDSVEFDLQLTSGAAVRVQQMHADALTADDVATVIVPPPRQLRALLVTDGNYFLEKAIKSLDLREPAVETPKEYDASWSDPKNNPNHFDVIVFDAYVPARLPAAGNFIWFAAVPPGIGVTAEKNGADFARVRDARFLDWQTDHPILRGLSLQSISLRDTLDLHLTTNAQVLAQGLRGPLIVLDREKQQTHLIVGFDLWQSDWPEHVSFPIFMRNAMQFMALGSQMNVQAAFEPGDMPRISRNVLAKMGDVKEIRVKGEKGVTSVKVPPTGDLVLPPLERVGIYATEPPVPGLEEIAVNLLNQNESDLNAIEVRGGSQPSSAAATRNERSQSDLWRWLIACGVLPLLLAEWWVYARRVHM